MVERLLSEPVTLNDVSYALRLEAKKRSGVQVDGSGALSSFLYAFISTPRVDARRGHSVPKELLALDPRLEAASPRYPAPSPLDAAVAEADDMLRGRSEVAFALYSPLLSSGAEGCDAHRCAEAGGQGLADGLLEGHHRRCAHPYAALAVTSPASSLFNVSLALERYRGEKTAQLQASAGRAPFRRILRSPMDRSSHASEYDDADVMVPGHLAWKIQREVEALSEVEAL